jgi:hypothetical protein
MSDKELLELAAKAAGIELMKNFLIADRVAKTKNEELWAPLEDDGDALRLAVKLKIDITFDGFEDDSVLASWDTEWVMEDYKDDPYAATRRAIVRAAAEIGRGME